MSQIIAVSKVGKNVLTATNPNDFIFHSNYNTLKIIAEGTYQYTLPENPQNPFLNIDISHMQPITPLVFAFVKYNNQVHMIGNDLSNRYPDATYRRTVYNVGTNNSIIRFECVNGGPPATIVLKYYIFEVPL